MPAAALNAPSHATEIGAVPPKLGDDAPSAADTERGERDQSKGGRPQNHGHTLEARSISPQCNNGNGVARIDVLPISDRCICGHWVLELTA